MDLTPDIIFSRIRDASSGLPYDVNSKNQHWRNASGTRRGLTR